MRKLRFQTLKQPRVLFIGAIKFNDILFKNYRNRLISFITTSIVSVAANFFRTNLHIYLADIQNARTGMLS